MILSPHMLETYEKCPQMYYLKYVKNFSLPQKPFLFETGEKIHALANYFLNNENISKMEKTLNAREKEYFEYLKSSKYFDFDVIDTEYNLSCKIDKYWVGGRLDALVKTQDNSYYILDYKTGEIPENAETCFQTIVYLLAVDKFIKEYKSLKFVYLGLKNKTEKIIELTPQTKKSFEEKVIKTCKKIELNVFEKCENCDTCEYKNFCN